MEYKITWDESKEFCLCNGEETTPEWTKKTFGYEYVEIHTKARMTMVELENEVHIYTIGGYLTGDQFLELSAYEIFTTKSKIFVKDVYLLIADFPTYLEFEKFMFAVQKTYGQGD